MLAFQHKDAAQLHQNPHCIHRSLRYSQPHTVWQKQPQKKPNDNNSALGFQGTLWPTADKLWGTAITQKRARCTG
jgi:hypothetical protein